MKNILRQCKQDFFIIQKIKNKQHFYDKIIPYLIAMFFCFILFFHIYSIYLDFFIILFIFICEENKKTFQSFLDSNKSGIYTGNYSNLGLSYFIKNKEYYIFDKENFDIEFFINNNKVFKYLKNKKKSIKVEYYIKIKNPLNDRIQEYIIAKDDFDKFFVHSYDNNHYLCIEKKFLDWLTTKKS